MNPWKKLHKKFKALVEAEHQVVQQQASRSYCYAYIIHRESGEFYGSVEGIATEGLQAAFDLLSTEAGIALGLRSGTLPRSYWIEQLCLDLRATGSKRLRLYNDTAGIVEHFFEASAIFCTRLGCRWLENSVMPSANPAAAIAETRPRRGYRTEVRQWMVFEGISTIDIAARRLGISVSALKSIMSERGKPRYGHAALARVLGIISYKSEQHPTHPSIKLLII